MSGSTPAGVIITATKPDGATVNVTAGVQTLYDCVIQSMDWGSGFLTVEDALPILEIAQVCGFKGYEEAERYVEAERRAIKQRECTHPSLRREPSSTDGYEYVICEACEWRQVQPKGWRS